MNALRLSLILACTIAGLAACAALGDPPFASEVVAYAPAPGHWVNNSYFNDPALALGPPVGGGSFAPGNTSLVTLGGFGGSLTLRFPCPVEDDPLNPMGLDAIVFGNAFWVGSPEQHWAECAVIEISRDENGNGIADDAWYLIPGSHLSWPLPPVVVQTWDDDVDDETYPPLRLDWIPEGVFGTWTTSAYLLPAQVFAQSQIANPFIWTGVEGIYGYADYTPTLILGDTDGDNDIDDPSMSPDDFYTTADDPHALGISPGSGGGDAFDIAWAIDPDTGGPAGLPEFHFIRITNAVHYIHGSLGEISPEIDAVADARPDPVGDYDADGDIDLADAAGLQRCFVSPAPGDDGCSRCDRDHDEIITLAEAGNVLGRMTNPR